MENNEKLKKYLDHYGAQIYTSYNDEDNCSFHVYRQDTADGYEVFIAKYKSDTSIDIQNDLHYYAHTLDDVIVAAVNEGETVYVDEDLWCDHYLEDHFADLYDREFGDDD